MKIIFVCLCCSFIHNCAYRYPHKNNGRSHCDFCFEQLTVLDLIPLFSFLHQRGHCRYCHQKLSPHYFISELLGLVIGITFELNLITLHTTFLLLIHLYVFYTDFYHRLISLRSHFCYLLLMDFSIFKLLFLTLFSLCLVYFQHKNMIGMGDLLLLFSSGFILSPLQFSWCLLLASTLGILVALQQKITRNYHLPFGSFWVISHSIIHLVGELLK